jgi:hypothetical protein
MDSYLCEDSEELYRKYEIVEPENATSALLGIVGIFELARAGRTGDVLEGIRTTWYFSSAWRGACRGGQKELVELMIQKTRSSDVKISWDGGLAEACRGGHKELVLLMIENGACNFDWGLEEACEYGHREMVELMIERGATAFTSGLRKACLGGHVEIALLMFQKMEFSEVVVNNELQKACSRGRKEIARLMVEKGATKCDCYKSLSDH